MFFLSAFTCIRVTNTSSQETLLLKFLKLYTSRMLSKANGLVKVTQRKYLCIQDLCHQVLNWFFLSHFIFYDSFYLVFKIIKSSENKLTL